MPEARTKPAHPHGLGLYIRRMSRRTIEARCKKMADHGVTWAAIGAVWQRSTSTTLINPPDVCHAIAEGLLKNRIQPWVWGYPWKGREVNFVAKMKAASFLAIQGWLLDPEKGAKDMDEDVAFAEAKELFWAVVRSNPYRVIGMSSYGLPRGHPTFPWEAFGDISNGFNPLKEVDFGAPQLYDQTPARIRRGLEQWRARGFDVLVPCFGTYRYDKDEDGLRIYPRMNEPELTQHLQAFLDLKDEFSIPAVIGWSEAQISRGGWRAIEKLAGAFR